VHQPEHSFERILHEQGSEPAEAEFGAIEAGNLFDGRLVRASACLQVCAWWQPDHPWWSHQTIHASRARDCPGSDDYGQNLWEESSDV